MIPDFPVTVAERMAQFCKHFEVEPCKLRYRRRATDEIIMTDELLAWHGTNGASLDWICVGNVIPMMAAYRKEDLSRQRMLEALRSMSVPEATAMLFVLKACLDEGIELEPALELWKVECSKRREEAA
ncbi:MAG: hypothetical protein ACK5LJ_11565 [Paracoccus sp. (in: a-proteobacteria)]